MKSRSSIIDMMRAIGIILVVLGHCLPSSFLFLKRLIYLGSMSSSVGETKN